MWRFNNLKPYGREKFYKAYTDKDGFGKTDYHPPKGYINWWENICGLVPRATQKQNFKKQVDRELTEENIK